MVMPKEVHFINLQIYGSNQTSEQIKLELIRKENGVKRQHTVHTFIVNSSYRNDLTIKQHSQQARTLWAIKEGNGMNVGVIDAHTGEKIPLKDTNNEFWAWIPGHWSSSRAKHTFEFERNNRLYKVWVTVGEAAPPRPPELEQPEPEEGSAVPRQAFSWVSGATLSPGDAGKAIEHVGALGELQAWVYNYVTDSYRLRPKHKEYLDDRIIEPLQQGWTSVVYSSRWIARRTTSGPADAQSVADRTAERNAMSADRARNLVAYLRREAFGDERSDEDQPDTEAVRYLGTLEASVGYSPRISSEAGVFLLLRPPELMVFDDDDTVIGATAENWFEIVWPPGGTRPEEFSRVRHSSSEVHSSFAHQFDLGGAWRFPRVGVFDGRLLAFKFEITPKMKLQVEAGEASEDDLASINWSAQQGELKAKIETKITERISFELEGGVNPAEKANMEMLMTQRGFGHAIKDFVKAKFGLSIFECDWAQLELIAELPDWEWPPVFVGLEGKLKMKVPWGHPDLNTFVRMELEAKALIGPSSYMWEWMAKQVGKEILKESAQAAMERLGQAVSRVAAPVAAVVALTYYTTRLSAWLCHEARVRGNLQLSRISYCDGYLDELTAETGRPTDRNWLARGYTQGTRDAQRAIVNTNAVTVKTALGRKFADSVLEFGADDVGRFTAYRGEIKIAWSYWIRDNDERMRQYHG